MQKYGPQSVAIPQAMIENNTCAIYNTAVRTILVSAYTRSENTLKNTQNKFQPFVKKIDDAESDFGSRFRSDTVVRTQKMSQKQGRRVVGATWYRGYANKF